ncbi:MAG: peptide deformylase [Clostridia bacterium]|nr:peptide deformylase [Clostridia bacterium]
MAVRNLFYEGDEVLRRKCRQVEAFDERTCSLIDDLNDTLDKIGGLGLAAPQVGVLKRIAVVHYDSDKYEMVNPIILETSGESIDNEGCLSIKGYRGIVKRPSHAKIEYSDRTGKRCVAEVEGYKARAFLHEIDHLDGILFSDRMIRKISTKK